MIVCWCGVLSLNRSIICAVISIISPSMMGLIACAGGKEIVLSGDGLDICTLASAQRVGPFDLSAGTLVVFIGGRLDKFEMATT